MCLRMMSLERNSKHEWWIAIASDNLYTVSHEHRVLRLKCCGATNEHRLKSKRFNKWFDWFTGNLISHLFLKLTNFLIYLHKCIVRTINKKFKECKHKHKHQSRKSSSDFLCGHYLIIMSNESITESSTSCA